MVMSCGLKQTLSKGFTLLGGMKYDANKGARAGLMDGEDGEDGDGSFSVGKTWKAVGFLRFSQVFLAQHLCPAQGLAVPSPR